MESQRSSNPCTQDNFILKDFKLGSRRNQVLISLLLAEGDDVGDVGP